jgi:hypothetical protein
MGSDKDQAVWVKSWQNSLKMATDCEPAFAKSKQRRDGQSSLCRRHRRVNFSGRSNTFQTLM